MENRSRSRQEGVQAEPGGLLMLTNGGFHLHAPTNRVCKSTLMKFPDAAVTDSTRRVLQGFRFVHPTAGDAFIRYVAHTTRQGGGIGCKRDLSRERYQCAV